MKTPKKPRDETARPRAASPGDRRVDTEAPVDTNGSAPANSAKTPRKRRRRFVL